MGNAAIAGIQAGNARNATKPAQAPIEINPGSPQLRVSDLDMPLAPIQPANVDYTVQSGDTLSGSLAARQAFIAQVEAKGGPAIDPRTASSSDWTDYVNSYSHLGESPAGAQTLGEMVVTPDYSYVKASPAENAYFAAMNRYLDSVSVDQADIARVNAANARQYATDQAQQRQLEELDGQSERYLATLPYQIGKGALETGFNAVAALPQQIWNGLKMYGAADLDYAAASASLAGNNNASVQLSDAAEADRAAALQPAWVPFQNLSPEEQFGGDVAMVAGLFTGYGEAEFSELGSVVRGADEINLSASPEGISVSTNVFRFQDPNRVETAWDVVT